MIELLPKEKYDTVDTVEMLLGILNILIFKGHISQKEAFEIIDKSRNLQS